MACFTALCSGAETSFLVMFQEIALKTPKTRKIKPNHTNKTNFDPNLKETIKIKRPITIHSQLGKFNGSYLLISFTQLSFAIHIPL